jgi:phosphoribosylamine--glycine ligase
MRVLLIGSGGREHAIAWKLVQSDKVDQVYVAPGNGGTADLPKAQNVPLADNDVTGLRDFALENEIELTVVGPEVPLTLGVVDLFQDSGLRIFGPTQSAAQLEGSKAFSKEFMEKYDIPTGSAVTFIDFDEVARYLRQLDDVPVIKASGLAAGKGVILPVTMAEAAIVARRMLEEESFGEAGTTVLVEERMEGPEISVLAFCDGTDLAIMPAAQDHKRLLDNDRGPNTGGMGAFAPSPLATDELLVQVRKDVLEPALAGMAAEGTPYVGVLYAGIMLTEDGIKVLEFNCRFGDPETQAILPLLDSDLVEIFDACINGTLTDVDISWKSRAAVTVVLASDGYPGDYTTGIEITKIDEAVDDGALVFHAGTKFKEGRLLTDGGRVLAVTGLGRDLNAAAHAAYGGVNRVHFNNPRYRKDIAAAWRRR